MHEGTRVDLSIPHGVCRVLSEVAGITEDAPAAGSSQRIGELQTANDEHFGGVGAACC